MVLADGSGTGLSSGRRGEGREGGAGRPRRPWCSRPCCCRCVVADRSAKSVAGTERWVVAKPMHHQCRCGRHCAARSVLLQPGVAHHRSAIVAGSRVHPAARSPPPSLTVPSVTKSPPDGGLRVGRGSPRRSIILGLSVHIRDSFGRDSAYGRIPNSQSIIPGSGSYL